MASPRARRAGNGDCENGWKRSSSASTGGWSFAAALAGAGLLLNQLMKGRVLAGTWLVVDGEERRGRRLRGRQGAAARPARRRVQDRRGSWESMAVGRAGLCVDHGLQAAAVSEVSGRA